MQETLQLPEGTYIGQTKEHIPHGVGYCFKESDYEDRDGIDYTYRHYIRGIWTEGILSGMVWEYRYSSVYGGALEDDLSETCSFRDTHGLTLLGVNREGEVFGFLSEKLTQLEMSYGRAMLTRNGSQCWGKYERDGHVFMGQLSSPKERPFYAEDFFAHGFAIETEGDHILYCGMFSMGVRKGLGVVWSKDEDSRFKMDFRIF